MESAVSTTSEASGHDGGSLRAAARRGARRLVDKGAFLTPAELLVMGVIRRLDAGGRGCRATAATLGRLFPVGARSCSPKHVACLVRGLIRKGQLVPAGWTSQGGRILRVASDSAPGAVRDAAGGRP